MSAEILRRAAALMRERAEAVNYPSPWGLGSGTCDIRCNQGRNYVAVASTYGGIGTEESAAAHIASWHPAVALAVADLLDTAVIYAESPDGLPRYMESKALAVARAYLGSES